MIDRVSWSVVGAMETVIRTTEQVNEANTWVLVLTAAGIPHRLETAESGWALLVPTSEIATAREALDASDQEQGDEAPRRVDGSSVRVAWAVGLAAAGSLLVFFVVTGPWTASSRWFERGAAAAGPTLHGEPWRALTALTLHADSLHVLGNAVAAALLLPAIVQPLGPGLGVWLPLLAGMGANVVAASIYPPAHVAVGASTATFGMIGILAALQFSSPATRSDRRWVIPIATLLLLTMLGTGRDADILAHMLGLVCGGGLGFLVAGRRRALTNWLQWSLVGAAALIVVGGWHLALSATRR